jgi:transposase InsO family protein
VAGQLHFIWIAERSWLCVAVFLDLFSLPVVGRSTEVQRDASLVRDAFMMWGWRHAGARHLVRICDLPVYA